MFQLRPWEVEEMVDLQVRTLAYRIEHLNREAEKQQQKAEADG